MTLTSYRLTAGFPKHELFGLTSQIRHCSSSIPANIAEGCGRMGNSEFHRFLQMACGSANEWNIICSWVGISGTLKPPITNLLNRSYSISSACWSL
ncbi:MAG TPA: four helix bundle protein [Verrucomicrobiae bacterium]|nr:four helix bundle protein [Verrucomicrobiae bacterium]